MAEAGVDGRALDDSAVGGDEPMKAFVAIKVAECPLPGANARDKFQVHPYGRRRKIGR